MSTCGLSQLGKQSFQPGTVSQQSFFAVPIAMFSDMSLYISPGGQSPCVQHAADVTFGWLSSLHLLPGPSKMIS